MDDTDADRARRPARAPRRRDTRTTSGRPRAIRFLWRWLPVVQPQTRGEWDGWMEAALERTDAGLERAFATVLVSDGKAAGSTRYLNIHAEHRTLEIGWTWLAPSAWGTGANAEAKLLQLEYAFETLGCRRVEFKTDALNERARPALAALPAQFEGIFRKHMLVRDGRVVSCGSRVGARDAAPRRRRQHAGRERGAEQDDRAADDHRQRDPLAEEYPAPDDGERRDQEGHRDRVRRTDVRDQAEIEEVGEAGAGEGEHRGAQPARRASVPAASHAGAGTSEHSAAATWLPAATASGGTPCRWRLVKFGEKP